MDKQVSQDREVAMFQRVITAYHRITRTLRNTTAPRWTVRLNVVALEERATPAGGLLPPIQPPTTVLVTTLPPVVAPAVNANAAVPSVRTDLFGAGAEAKPQQSDDLDNMVADQTANVSTANETPAQPQTTDGNDDTGAVIVEGEPFVPYVE
jgi:hypothetical protein